MTKIDPTLASHKLNVIPSAKPVRQKIRHFHLDRHQIIQTEVDNLLRAGFIREVKYPEWLSNVAVVPKRAVNGEYAWTTRTSTKLVQEIASPCHE